MNNLNVYIGYDKREHIAYEVSKASIEKYSGVKVEAIVKSRWADFKYKDVKSSSSEFTMTRFLTPYINNFTGFALFIDCDTLIQTSIEKILEEADLNCAVNCVQHDYIPKTSIKMDNKTQHVYPRKNWSSVMLFNCQHPLVVNNLSYTKVVEATPKYLHRMEWAKESIGSLHHTWNYLAGYYDDIEKPNIIHYTDGGPWFDNYKNCTFADEWRKEFESVNNRNNRTGWSLLS